MGFQVVDQCSKEFILSAFKPEKYKTDSAVFRLHYKLSTWVVILYSMCYMFVQYESPIYCMGSSKKLGLITKNQKGINDFCWVHGTYTLTGKDDLDEDIFPGIRRIANEQDEVFYHDYYKWMYFYIVVMLIMLHVPRQTWRFIEAGRMKTLANRLNLTQFIRDAEIEQEEANLADYLVSHLGYHRLYALGFFLCELMNIVVASVLLSMWDLMSGHQLSIYGWSSLSYLRLPPVERTDGLAKAFPLLGKCIIDVFGPSGDIVSHDLLCVLPLNVVNERAAVFFWCYFVILVIAGAVEVGFQILLMLSKRLRATVLSWISPLTPLEDINLIVGQSYSDWFVINHASKCTEVAIFNQVLAKYVVQLRSKVEDIV